MSRDATEKTPRGSTPPKKVTGSKGAATPPLPPAGGTPPETAQSSTQGSKNGPPLLPRRPAKASDAPRGVPETKPVAQSPSTSTPAKPDDKAIKPATPDVEVPASPTAAAPVSAEKPAVPPRSSTKPTTAPTPTAPTSTAPTPTAAATKKAALGPRRVRLAVSRVDPWSIMKLSFLLSIAIGIMLVVAAIVFWLVLDGLHVFTEVNDMVVEILGKESKVDLLQYVEFKRVVSLATIIAIVDVVLVTALSTIGAFLYNVVATLVGGVHLTLIDE